MANEVKVTFAGDARDLASAFDQVGSASEGMASKVERTTTTIRESGGAAREWQDRFDALDQGAMGFRDTITGVQDSMAGMAILDGSAQKAFDDYAGEVERAERILKKMEEGGKASAASIQYQKDQVADMKKHLGELEQQTGSTADGLLLMGMGVGDLASGMANLIIPLAAVNVQTVKTTATMVAGWASTAGAAAASVATQVGAWIALGVQSLASAAQVALAWLISMGPIILVGAAVIGLVVLIVRNWDTIKSVIGAGWDWVKSNTAAAWNWVKSAVSGAVSFVVNDVRSKIDTVKAIFSALRSAIGSIMSGLASTITAPFRTGFAAIRSIWNSTIGGRGFNVPDWVPAIGGRSFRIPHLADGGVLKARPGGVPFIGAEAGQDEAVIPLDRLERMIGGGGGVVELRVMPDGSHLGSVLVELLRQSIRTRGGDVQVVLGA